MDEMTTLEHEQTLKQKMQTVLFLSVVKKGGNHGLSSIDFDTDPNFLRYKRKLLHVTDKIT